MNTHLLNEIDKIKSRLLTVSAIVEEAVSKAVTALIERDITTAQEVIKNDGVIDKMEVELEEDCLKVLALHQPVANDLRFIISALKINNDLERIGDLAVNIAGQVMHLLSHSTLTIPDSISTMTEKSQVMLKHSLDALIRLDTGIARQVCKDDEVVDDLHKDTFTWVEEQVQTGSTGIRELLHVATVSRYLERIADHATNIAEDVIYMVDGKIARHVSDL